MQVSPQALPVEHTLQQAEPLAPPQAALAPIEMGATTSIKQSSEGAARFRIIAPRPTDAESIIFRLQRVTGRPPLASLRRGRLLTWFDDCREGGHLD